MVDPSLTLAEARDPLPSAFGGFDGPFAALLAASFLVHLAIVVVATRRPARIVEPDVDTAYRIARWPRPPPAPPTIRRPSTTRGGPALRPGIRRE